MDFNKISDQKEFDKRRMSEALKIFRAFFVIFSVGGSITLYMMPRPFNETIVYIAILIAVCSIEYFIMSYMIKNEIDISAFYNVALLVSVSSYFIVITASYNNSIITVACWFPILLIIMYFTFEYKRILAFMTIHTVVVILYWIYQGESVFYVNKGTYVSLIPMIMILAIASYRLMKLFNNREHELLDKLSSIADNNLELQALNEEYYAAQDELFHQYDQILGVSKQFEMANERFEAILNVADSAIIDYCMTSGEYILSEKAKLLIKESDNDYIELLLGMITFNDSIRLSRMIDKIITNEIRTSIMEVELSEPFVGMQYLQITVLKYISELDHSEHIVFSIQNISERKSQALRVEYLAYYDELTGLLNRRGLELELNKKIEAESSSFWLIYMNIVEFHGINNIFGYEIGDEVLTYVANIIKSRPDLFSTGSRISADVFGFTMRKNADIKLIDEMFNTEINTSKAKITLRINFGASIFPETGTDGLQLIKQSELSLAKAKQLKTERYYIYNSSMAKQLERRLHMSSLLKDAIASNSIKVLFQPIVDCLSNKVIGYEALSRWQSQELGYVSPPEFIEHAESIGVIDGLGDLILRRVCEFLSSIRDARDDITVSINLTGVQLFDDTLVSNIKTIVDEYGLPYKSIAFEVTEGILIENYDIAVSQLSSLREMGFKIYLDDFGTGYSSLSYLISLPLDVLKIDRSFVREIHFDKNKLMLLESFLHIGNGLGLELIIEGVEEEEELDTVKKSGHSLIQGYYFSKPLEKEDAIEFLAKSQKNGYFFN